MSNGLLMVYTGAREQTGHVVLGQVLRSSGRGLKICVVDFEKPGMEGALSSLPGPFGDRVEVHRPAFGDRGPENEEGEPGAAMIKTWELARGKVRSGLFDIVILADVAELIRSGVASEGMFLEALEGLPDDLTVILTGDTVSAALADRADLITEIAILKG
ncbi:MAG: cob(I)yrinic acid a,c-diamide adenosyltransferase [Pseudomonadota bacterium]